MKFTSEDLLKAMGLKDGNYITFEDDTRLFEVVSEEKELYLVCDLKKFNFFNKTLNKNFVIIQPKPTLTEDEKVILKNVPKEYKYVMRDSYGKGGNLVLSKEFPERNWVIIGGDGYWLDNRKQFPCTWLGLFNHLFQFIKWEDEPYLIEELLKE